MYYYYSNMIWCSVSCLENVSQGPFVQNLTDVMLKYLSLNMANTLIFLLKKNVYSICVAMQKLLTFFFSKNINVFENTIINISVYRVYSFSYFKYGIYKPREVKKIR